MFLLTPFQQLAVEKFSENVDATGDFVTSTLASEVRQIIDGGDWLLFSEQLAMTNNVVHTNVEQFFLAICGFSPASISNKVSEGQNAFTFIAAQIDSDDVCPFEETSDYLMSFADLEPTAQQNVADVLVVAIPLLQLPHLIEHVLLPAIVEQHKKRSSIC